MENLDENLEDMTLEERVQRLQRLENRNIEIPMDPLSLQERFYKLERTTPFRFSDYPRLRRHIIDRDTLLYDLPPVVEDRYTTYDDEGSVRDMASSILAKRYKKKRNHNIRTLKAKDRFDIARMIEAGLPEEIGRKIARERNKIDIYQLGSSSRKRKSKKNTRRHRTTYRMDSEEPELDLEPEPEPEPELDLEQELDNLLTLPPDIQELIGNNLNKIKLEKLKNENNILIDKYQKRVPSNLHLHQYSFIFNPHETNLDILNIDSIILHVVSKLLNIPEYIVVFFLDTVEYLKDDIIKFSNFRKINLQVLFKYFANGTNLSNFILTFRTILLTSYQYTPLQVEIFINNILNKLTNFIGSNT